MTAQASKQAVVQAVPVFGFMHIATQGRWRQFVGEQLALIRSSGLYQRMTKLFLGIVGPESGAVEFEDDKIEVVHRSPDFEEYEFPTLRYLHSFCRSHDAHDALVFYVHTKGVFRDNEATADWRHYMEYFNLERHEDCIRALQSRDVCGVNWQEMPWPHFSGNFWWARSRYVAGLAPIDSIGPVVNGWNLGRRHQCERWIGSGTQVRPACFHETHLHHYMARYPRQMYTGPEYKEGGRPQRVAVIFDNVVRRDTTGIYCLRALRQLTQVSHYLPSEIAWVPPNCFDLFLFIDDGLEYALPPELHPSALWAIDTHLNPRRLIERAKDIDFVFAAQRDGVEILRQAGVNCVGWLPLACDPDIHQRIPCDKELDVCFVAHLCTEERQALADRIRERFPCSFVGQRFFSEMAQTYSSSRIVLNLSVRNDVNMRVFEALACGSLLLTNDLAENGLASLFTDGRHLVTYRDMDDLIEKVGHYLKDDEARERIAAAGHDEALARHTYVHRMKVLLDTISSQAPPVRSEPDVPSSASCNALTSIILVTCNALEYTKLCLESIQRCTHEPHELIVVDNGSTDGTREFLREQLCVRLIENSENRGFPAAANQGIRASRGGQILLLNNDVIVTPGWLERLLAALRAADEVGLVGPCSNHVSGPQQVEVSYSEISGVDAFAEQWARDHVRQIQEVDRLVGFCLLFRREVVDRIGLLDERFGIGNFEDDDYCRRAKLAGFRVLIAGDCFVHHFGSATFKANGTDYAAILHRNQKLFDEKWRSEATTLARANAAENEPPNSVLISSGDPNLSLCMIVRDSARTLRQCLTSVRPWVDEIVVVDTGSTDQTIEIAKQVGARVHHFPWRDDFSAARNESLRHAHGRWIFWMDSDDTIDPENGRKLQDLVSREFPENVLGFVMQVHCPAGREGGPYSTCTVVDHVKMFRNHPAIRFSGRIHEQVLPAIRQLGGEIEWTDIFVCHSGSDVTPEGRVRKQQRDLRILRQELADDPDHTFTLFNVGMTLLDMGRPGEALDALCRSLQLASPGESHIRKIYALLVQCYAELGRRHTALKTCRQGLEACPGDAELSFRAGALQQGLGQLDAAERSFRMVIESKRDRYFSSVDDGILGIKAWHNLAILHEIRRQFGAAADAWGHVLEYDRSNRLAWRGLLDSATSADDTPLLERLSEADPGQQVPADVRLFARARVAARGGNAAAAVAQLEEAARTDPSLDLLNELCELAFRSNEIEAAERGLIELTRRCPDDPSACQNRAMVHLRRKNYVEAQRWARRSLQLRPEYGPSKQLLEAAMHLAEQSDNDGSSSENEDAVPIVVLGKSLIGDALFAEPAIRALSQELGRPVPLLLEGPARALFQTNPHVALLEPRAEARGPSLKLDAMDALIFARSHRTHICAGFFSQLGLEVGEDCKPRVYRDGVPPGVRLRREERIDRIALAPFSTSCLVHRTGTANKTMPIEWWNALVPRLSLPADSFGAAHELPVEGCENYRGLPLDEVAGWLRQYQLLITTDNGLCAVAGALNCDIVLLESASSPALTGPQTTGMLEVIWSGTPPNWDADEVLAAVGRILDTREVVQAEDSGALS